jgi:thioester reductase-like protein
MNKVKLWTNKTPKEQKFIIALLIDAMLHSDVATKVIERTLQKFIDKGYVQSKFIGEEFVDNTDEQTHTEDN